MVAFQVYATFNTTKYYVLLKIEFILYSDYSSTTLFVLKRFHRHEVYGMIKEPSKTQIVSLKKIIQSKFLLAFSI